MYTHFFFLSNTNVCVGRAGLDWLDLVDRARGIGEISQRRKGLVLVPVVPPPIDPPVPITPPTPDGPPKISAGCTGPPGPISKGFPAGPMGDIPPKGMPIGLDCTIPMPIPGAAIGTPIPGMPIPG